MKRLTSAALQHVTGAMNLELDNIMMGLDINFDDISPDLRFDPSNPYAHRFDAPSMFKAGFRGNNYLFDMLSESGNYVLEAEVSFGGKPLKGNHDFEIHCAYKLPGY